MSEIHILDREVRPESLCGYTGPPGEGEPTCAACLAVDDNLVFPASALEYVTTPLFSAAAAATALGAVLVFWPAAWEAARVVIIALGVGLIAAAISLTIRRALYPPHLEGEILKEEVHG
jgi:hypothetical protein